MTTMKKPFDLSDAYWDSLSAKHQALYDLVRPMPTAAYTVDWMISMLETTLERMAEEQRQAGGTFELEPDFQRGHVWTEQQRVAFIESLLRKTAPNRILFNCPGWSRSTASAGAGGDIAEHTFQCVDGLQRLTAVRKFMAGEFGVFGGLGAQDLRGSPFDLGRYRLQMAVYEFNNRADLLNFYLHLNEGGTPHGPEELARVRQLLMLARQP